MSHGIPLLSTNDCNVLIAAAGRRGLRSSLSAARALDPLALSLAFQRPAEAIDVDSNGVIDAHEVGIAVRASLNTPLFDEDDALAWLLAATGAPDIPVAALAELRANSKFAKATQTFFANRFLSQPETFSRFSEQVALPWNDLLNEDDTKKTAEHIASELARLTGWSREAITSSEDMQVIRYGAGGHYAPHSDSGWPGHRPVSVLIYLRTPESGGETCFLPRMTNYSESAKVAGRYLTDCSNMFAQTLDAACVKPTSGDAVIWQNRWQENGNLEVPGAHVACPVHQGEKWVAGLWISEPCLEGQVCGTMRR